MVFFDPARFWGHGECELSSFNYSAHARCYSNAIVQPMYDEDDLRTLNQQQYDAYLRRILATCPKEDSEARIMLHHLCVFWFP
jgi:hypothetical protein